ncbi:MAG: AzlC family ABC transporter permease [bacterium]|nr:AzlC family ABC transporter permease [bacterium]
MKQCNVKSEFLRGIQTGIPILVGFFPVATTFAVLASQSGMNALETSMMSVMVLAGSSQIVAVQMLAAGSGMIEIVFAVFFLNLRHFIMSTYVMRRLNWSTLGARLVMAFGVTDETFALYSVEPESSGAPFFAGVACMTYFSWIVGTLAGTFLIQLIPQKICSYLVIALYAMFIQIIAPRAVRDSDILKTVIISILLNCVLSIWIPSGWSVIISMLSGAAIGSTLRLRKEAMEDACENMDTHVSDVSGDIHTESSAGISGREE